MFERLDADEILRTGERLEQRIKERFPDASLRKLAARLAEITRESMIEVARLRRPNIPLRVGVSLLLAAGLAVLVIGQSMGQLLSKDRGGVEARVPVSRCNVVISSQNRRATLAGNCRKGRGEIRWTSSRVPQFPNKR